MEIALVLAAFGISLGLGHCVLQRLLIKEEPLEPILHLFWAAGLGLGLSAEIIFYNLVVLDQLNRPFVLLIHGVVFFLLIFPYRASPGVGVFLCRSPRPAPHDILSIFLILVFLTPTWAYAHFYPFGGWDAWQVWNFKAKFIFLGGENWKNMLAPDLWRTSPHYPLLLPLINVWGWIFLKEPIIFVPLLTSVVFTFLTAGLMYSSLKKLTASLWAVVPSLFVVSLPFFVKLATSQYSEIAMAYYLLAGIFCLLQAYQRKSIAFCVLAGLFLGLLGFTKNEGSLAALVVVGWAALYLIHREKNSGQAKRLWFSLVGGCAVTFLPTILFEALYSPGNQTFVNGLFSASQPSTFERLKFTLIFFAGELSRRHWNGLWLCLLVGVLLSRGRCFRREIVLIPFFLLSFVVLIIFYYYLNTYFKIFWWLQVTLHRVLFFLVPTVVFWVWMGIWKSSDS